MQHFFTTQQKHAAHETKEIVSRLMEELEIMQEELAFLSGVHQSTISRFRDPNSEIYPSLFILSNCLNSNNEKGVQFALRYLDYLENLAGRDAAPRVLRRKPDGSLMDEFRDLAIAEGEFGKVLDADIEKAEKIARKVQEIAQRMLSEVKHHRETKRSG